MTPQEKAEELVDKFYQTTPNEAWINEPLGISEEYNAWKQAKQCALMAVDEILKDLKVSLKVAEDLHPHARGLIMGSFADWLEVKQELEKL
jgi:hypothetical protein